MTITSLNQEKILEQARAYTGQTVELPAMLYARERRAELQRELLLACQTPLVSFTLNIPGPVKVLPLVPEAFLEGISRIEAALSAGAMDVCRREYLLGPTGPEAFFAVHASRKELKKAMVSIEDGSELGRLFDIDVIGIDGTKASRADLGLPARTCLLCKKPAHACARSRSHTVDELITHIESVLRKEFTHHGI